METLPRNLSDRALLNIYLVFPALPPARDTIGEYTAHLASTLARTCQVSLLTAQQRYDPIPGVSVQSAFTLNSTQFAQRHHIRGILDALKTETPDWLILQYNAFSYGRWGFNPHLPALLKAIKRQYPSVRCAVMAHETWPPSLNLRMAVMSSWQRWQLWQLGRIADVMLFSIQPWSTKFQRWFPRTPVHHLPVGSNMPPVAAERAHIERERVRRQLKIAKETFVIGVFGQIHHSRLLDYVRAAASAVERECQPWGHPQTPPLQVLYIGSQGQQMARILEGIPWIDAGRLEAEEVSPYFTAMDLFLSPFKRGVSTRRSSFMTALQQGVATVSTWGVQTDEMLKAYNGKAFLLADDRNVEEFCQLAVNLYRDCQCRQSLGIAARQLYQTAFDWEVISTRLLEILT
jgi:glycosyltransferase involved in cell wall biosynthesis